MRDDFSEEVKRVIAARVSYLCSNPACRAATSGPQINASKSLNVGVAAHITAASRGGPRHNLTLTPEERTHPNNAIWLCQNCGKLVDNDATRFTEDLLRQWKETAEAAALKVVGKTRVVGEHEELVVEIEKLTTTVQAVADHTRSREADAYYDVAPILAAARSRLIGVHASSADYHNGTEPTWLNIAARDDGPRDIEPALIDFIQDNFKSFGKIPVALILGRAGDGKSTALMRAAATLTDNGYTVLWHRPDFDTIDAHALTNRPGKKLIVCIDDATRLGSEEIEGALRYLHSISAAVIVIMAAREDMWFGLKPTIETFSHVKTFRLHTLSDNEIKGILDKLTMAKELGELAALSREDQEKRFKLASDRQLLVALLEAKYSMSFISIVQRDIRDIDSKFGSNVSEACYLVSALHTFGIEFPSELLAQLLKVSSLEADILSKTRGFLISPQMFNSGLKTRHSVISTVVFDNDPGRYDRLRTFITNVIDERQILLPRLFRNMRLQFKARNLEINQVRSLFQLALEPITLGRYTVTIWYLLERELKNFREAGDLLERAINLDPNFAPHWRTLAGLERQLGNYDRARSLFEKTVSINSGEATAWLSWTNMEKELGNFQEARRLFERAAQADPKLVRVWQAWAIMEKEQRNFVLARKYFQKATELEPNHAPSWQAWALLEKSIGKLQRAVDLFKKAANANPRHVPTLQAWAITEKELGHYHEASSLFDRAIKIDPQHAPSWQARAIMEKELGNYAKARQLFNRASKVSKNNGPSLQAWAVMEKELGKHSQARSLFKEATVRDPKHAYSWQAWAIMEKELGDYDEARRLFKKSVEVSPTHGIAYQAWAIMEKELGNVEVARDLFEKATKASPKVTGCWQAWALLELEAGDYSRAQEFAQRAVDLGPQEFYPFIARGQIQRALGNASGAYNDFEQAKRNIKYQLDRCPNDRRLLIPLATVLTYRQQYQDAERILQRLSKTSLKGQRHYVYNSLGELYEAQGMLDRAMSEWEKAINYAPGYLTALNNLKRVKGFVKTKGDNQK